MTELSKDYRAMIRAGAGDLDTAGVQALEAAVISRLTKMITVGNCPRHTEQRPRGDHVRTCGGQVMPKDIIYSC